MGLFGLSKAFAAKFHFIPVAAVLELDKEEGLLEDTEAKEVSTNQIESIYPVVPVSSLSESSAF